MSCQDQVDVVPPGAVVLASNAHCPVAMFRCGKMLGIQGHPEWEPEYAAALLGRRRDRIGADRVDAALAGVASPRNSGALSEWAKRRLTRVGEGDAVSCGQHCAGVAKLADALDLGSKTDMYAGAIGPIEWPYGSVNVT